MSITFKINGKEYTNYISATVKIRLDAMCNSFSITASNTKGQTFPFSRGDACEVYVDGTKKLTGRIEAFDGSYDSDNYTLAVHGRDKTADLLDSRLNISQITGSSSLKGICETIIAHLGADIEVVVEDGLSIDDFNLAEDIFAPSVGKSAYDFLENLAKKRNVLLSSNADGNLLLTKNSPFTSSGKLQSIINDTANQNNVVDASFSYDDTERFNVCICASQLNPVALNNAGETDLASVVGQSGRALDDAIAEGRQYVFEADTASSSGQLEPRAEWELNMRRARGTRYNVTVEGHSVSDSNSELWETNSLVQVRDDLAGISASLLVDQVTFITILSEGNITKISLTDKEAYSLFIKPKLSSRDVIGIGVGQDSSDSIVIHEVITKQVEQITGFNSKDVISNFNFDPSK